MKVIYIHRNIGEAVSTMDSLRVTKSNKLIEASLTEAAVKFSLRDHKVILAVISQISLNEKELKPLTLSISNLEKLTKIRNKHIYQDISAISDRLTSVKIKIKEPDEPKGFLEAPWFSAIRYRPSKGLIVFTLNQELKPYLIQVKSAFTSYYLSQVISLQSVYSIRFYPLLRQFLTLKDVKNGKTAGYRYIDLDELKDILGIHGDKYKKFSDLNRYVIKKCQNELSSKTDLAFDFQPIKEGRKITKIKLNIQSNETFEEVDEGSFTESELLPENYDEGVAFIIGNTVPSIPRDLVTLLASKIDALTATQACMSYRNAEAATKIEKPAAYFIGILKHQAKEMEKLKASQDKRDAFDRSWADNIDWLKDTKWAEGAEENFADESDYL